MEMEVMMALWLSEMDRLHNKNKEHEELAATEEFFVGLTIEFERARNARSPTEYLNWLLTQIELYLSGQPDQAVANVLAAGCKAAKAFGIEMRSKA